MDPANDRDGGRSGDGVRTEFVGCAGSGEAREMGEMGNRISSAG